MRKPIILQRREPPIPMPIIRRLAREIADKFKPNRIILFGSHARGESGPDSDVDLLVVMPAANEINQAIRIRLAVSVDFPLDLIVRKPDTLRKRLEWGDWFLRTVIDEGIVLYEKGHSRMDPQSGSRSRRRRTSTPVKATTD
ncbi:MAG: nucleotidyltransferase domain-containing protein [Planctomycetales bacterium]|nr:nucleotidyltransferase domain-containing protein [Planctomycetales bacterium]